MSHFPELTPAAAAAIVAEAFARHFDRILGAANKPVADLHEQARAMKPAVMDAFEEAYRMGAEHRAAHLAQTAARKVTVQ